MSGVKDQKRLASRHRVSNAFALICAASAISGVILLAILLFAVARDGSHFLGWKFLTSFPSRFPERAGIKSALWGTIWLVSLTAAFSIPIGVGAAIYLEEYAKKNFLSRFIQLNIANLAGVPSIVYGMLGLVIFVRWLRFERSVLSGACTMTLLILPTIIIAAQEAIKAVPNSLRYAAYSLGATKWQVVRHHVVPAAYPGILTGIILSLSRAMGETAPLIMIGALTYIAFIPKGWMDPFTALPIQIFNWASRPQHEFHELAAAGIVVLLAVLLSMNGLAIFLRQRFQRRLKW